MANNTCQARVLPVEERPGPVADLTKSRWCNVPDLHPPPDPKAPLAAETATTPARAVVGETLPTKRSRQLRGKLQRAYSFIGGILIGISISLPVLTVDVGEGGGALLLAGSLTLAATGIGMHLRGAKQTSTRR